MPFFFYFRSGGLSAPLPFFAVGTFSSTVTKLSQDVYGPKETPTYAIGKLAVFPLRMARSGPLPFVVPTHPADP